MAASRPDPIPFYGELGSLNPVFVGAAAAAARGAEIGKGLIASMTMGSGQFCTKPGVVFVPTGSDGDVVVAAMEADLSAREPNVLLNQGLQKSLDAKVAASRAVQGVREAVAVQDVPAEGFFAAPRLVRGGRPDVLRIARASTRTLWSRLDCRAVRHGEHERCRRAV